MTPNIRIAVIGPGDAGSLLARDLTTAGAEVIGFDLIPAPESSTPVVETMDEAVAGADIVLASPKGGQPPLDPKSDEADAQTDATRRFKGDDAAQKALAETVTLDSVSADATSQLMRPPPPPPLLEAAAAAAAASAAARGSASRLRATAEGAGRAVAERVAVAEKLRDDLSFLVERAETLADRLDGLVRDARPLAAEAPPAPPPPPLPTIPATGGAAVAALSQAERELLRALKGLR